jgi:hypothetical protein
MDIFEIEYAKMRQKELDRDIQAINAVRMARKKDLYLWNGKALAKVGKLRINLGRWLKQSGRRTDRNFDTAVQGEP